MSDMFKLACDMSFPTTGILELFQEDILESYVCSSCCRSGLKCSCKREGQISEDVSFDQDLIPFMCFETLDDSPLSVSKVYDYGLAGADGDRLPSHGPGYPGNVAGFINGDNWTEEMDRAVSRDYGLGSNWGEEEEENTGCVDDDRHLTSTPMSSGSSEDGVFVEGFSDVSTVYFENEIEKYIIDNRRFARAYRPRSLNFGEESLKRKRPILSYESFPESKRMKTNREILSEYRFAECLPHPGAYTDDVPCMETLKEKRERLLNNNIKNGEVIKWLNQIE